MAKCRYAFIGCLAVLTSGQISAQAVEESNLQQREQPFYERDFGREAAIEIRAINPLQCSVIFDEAASSVNLTAMRTEEVGVRLDCNAPFRLRARAANGALRHTELFEAGNVRSFLPYSVMWPSMVTNGGVPVAANFSAEGTQWAQGLDFVSGTTVAHQHGEMRISWNSPRELLAGDYQETFTIEMEPID